MLQEVIDALQRGQAPQALAAARAFVAAQPENPEAHHLLGLAARASNLVDEARSAFDRAIELAPDHPAYHMARAGLALQESDVEAARKGLDVAATLDPNQIRSHIVLAQLALGRGDVAECESRLKLAYRIDAAHPHALVTEGNLRFSQNRAEDALKLFTQAAQRAPNDPLAVSSLGIAYLRVGHLAFAEQALRRASQMVPQDLGVRRALITALRRQNRLDDAVAEARALAAVRAGDLAALMLVGELELERNQPEAALAAFRDVIAARPGVQPAINASVRILMSTGRRDEAVALLEAQIARTPELETLWRQRAAIEPTAEGVDAQLRRWADTRPGDAQAHQLMAERAEGAGDLAAAEAATDRALAAAPTLVAANILKARLLLRRDPEAALAQMQPMFDSPMKPVRAMAHNWAGRAADAAGRPADAVRHWLASHAELEPQFEYPAPGPLPATSGVDRDAAPAADAPILLWGPPGSFVPQLASLMANQAERKRLLMDDRRIFLDPRTMRGDGFSLPHAWLDGADKAPDATAKFAEVWRAGLRALGLPAGIALIDWLAYFDARLVPVLHRQLPGTTLVAAIRDPRDMLLNWLGYGAGPGFTIANPAVAAKALAQGLRHLLWTRDHGDLPVLLVKMEAVDAGDASVLAPVRALIGVEASTTEGAQPGPAKDAGGLPMAFPPGRWKAYAGELEAAFSVLAPLAAELGYAD